MTFEGERFDRWLFASVFFHGALFTLVIFSPKLFPAFQSNWGSPTGGSGGINVKIVGNLSSGVPLPRPEVVQEQAPANESPGFYKSEEAPPTPPPDKAELIPETKAPVKATPPPKQPKPAAAPKSAPPPEPPPSNAIPYGQGGRLLLTDNFRRVRERQVSDSGMQLSGIDMVGMSMPSPARFRRIG